MSYAFPPLVATITPALALVATNTNVVAAPGAGQRIRLVGGSLGANRSITGIAELAFTDGIGGTILGRGVFSLNSIMAVPLIIPEPGLQLSDNTPLVLNHIGTTAAGNAEATVYYYIDSVT